MKFKSLLGLAAVGMFTTSLVSVAYAAPAKNNSGMYAGVFYQPTFTQSLELTGKGGLVTGDTSAVDFKEEEVKDFENNWLAGGLELGYAMGNFVLAATVDMGGEVAIDKDDKEYVYLGSQLADATEEAVKLNKYSTTFFGVLADYKFGMGSVTPFVGAGIGMQYTKLIFNDAGTGTTEVSQYPIAAQGRVGLSYDMGGGLEPYASYTFRYTFSKDYDDSVPVLVTNGTSITNANDPAKVTLESLMQHVVQVGLRFNF